MQDLQPTKVLKINCPKCGELQLKIYPWSSFNIQEGSIIPVCKKCIAKEIKVQRAKQIFDSKHKKRLAL